MLLIFSWACHDSLRVLKAKGIHKCLHKQRHNSAKNSTKIHIGHTSMLLPKKQLHNNTLAGGQPLLSTTSQNTWPTRKNWSQWQKQYIVSRQTSIIGQESSNQLKNKLNSHDQALKLTVCMKATCATTNRRNQIPRKIKSFLKTPKQNHSLRVIWECNHILVSSPIYKSKSEIWKPLETDLAIKKEKMHRASWVISHLRSY